MEGILKKGGRRGVVNRGGIVTGEGHLLRSREFGSHSMYHQMLISSTSSPLPPPFSSSSSFVLPVHSAAAPAAPSSSHLRSGMEALRSSWPEAATSQPPSQNHEEAGLWGTEAEKAGLLPSEFVDELLNLGDFGENERERMENEELEAKAVVGDQGVKKMEGAGDQGMKKMEGEEHSSPSPSSVLSEISLPAHDVEELEWVSFIIDDSLSEFPAEVVAQVDNRLSVQRESRQRNHGASVATAALPCVPLPCVVSTEAPLPCVPLPCVCPSKAKRSKRSRSVTVGWSSSPPLTDSSSTTSTTSASSSSSYLIYDHSFCFQSLPPPPPPPSKKAKLPKKRGRKPKQQPPSAGALGGAATSGERRCSHCGAQKTPQWRAGPLGAKTLCNACGVRYKSGRLLPEYRPACSPTFVDSIHSSSHRKVLELRRQKEAELVLAVGPPPVATF